MKISSIQYGLLILLLSCGPVQLLQAQTDIDGDMMSKNLFCVGPMYSYSSWKNYWEGTMKRENLNIGRISTQMFGLMGNYAISKKLNLLFSAPYVKTKASEGTMQGMKGVQDLSLFVKWKPFTFQKKNARINVIAVGGYSFPLTNYEPDFLPLSIGLHSKNMIGRLMGDVQYKKIFITASAAYICRSNITLDRPDYYTTELHLTNEVEMPDVTNVNVRAGYRTKYVVAEAVLNRNITLGGFDITRNNMPFPSNKMNATSIGANFRYIPAKLPALNFNAGTDYVVAGRNTGQAFTVFGGVFYIFNFNHKTKSVFHFQN